MREVPSEMTSDRNASSSGSGPAFCPEDQVLACPKEAVDWAHVGDDVRARAVAKEKRSVRMEQA